MSRLIIIAPTWWLLSPRSHSTSHSAFHISLQIDRQTDRKLQIYLSKFTVFPKKTAFLELQTYDQIFILLYSPTSSASILALPLESLFSEIVSCPFKEYFHSFYLNSVQFFNSIACCLCIKFFQYAKQGVEKIIFEGSIHILVYANCQR